MKDISFHNPVAISLLEPGEWKSKLLALQDNNEKILILYSKSAMSGADPTGNLLDLLAKNRNITLITDIMSNPSIEHLKDIRSKASGAYKHVIAIGGGSVIDLAKILIALNSYPNIVSSKEILEIIKNKKYLEALLPDCKLIAIPTTAGTGSELTCWATIWDKVGKKKYSVERKELYPNEAWIDPAVTVAMSREVTASTGLDALSHAVEAYWSTKSNPIVRRLSAQSIRQIITHLKDAIQTPENIESRRGMCLGSVFAGLAFSQTRTTACHAISYPLTAQFGIPHGVAVAMSLIPVMKLNWAEIKEKGMFLESFKCNSIDEIERLLRSIVQQTISLRIIDYGVTRNDLIRLYDDTDFLKDRLGNNPVAIAPQSFVDLLLD